jgi:hypothetical protein
LTTRDPLRRRTVVSGNVSGTEGIFACEANGVKPAAKIAIRFPEIHNAELRGNAG